MTDVLDKVSSLETDVRTAQNTLLSLKGTKKNLDGILWMFWRIWYLGKVDLVSKQLQTAKDQAGQVKKDHCKDIANLKKEHNKRLQEVIKSHADELALANGALLLLCWH